ncbi:endonuclease/exonuclease/phosphatase family protein [Pandoraea sp.]|uniref:endonuclease/exonuclease/phosphatase family protein n=1 Tax=Pandoraea sp. TaxID=1883445 RepID=UPI0011F7D782|nr:endonuclease/exonuclease/phosphatase family protein [Pandoraea sp.]TAL55487.1 MAG: EEP domain-containing protein [Pandoraea sp.]TAM17813.1 MAG: EEP domain-containing protein [Pandoraea sp.]
MATPSPLHITSYNIHKGFSQFHRLRIHELRDRLEGLNPDLVFLQEVHGLHLRHAARHLNWPSEPQYQFLAGGTWQEHAYGRNVIYEHGDHGNAILSRFPILRSANHDITTHSFERRGMLHCEVAVPGWAQPLHCLCVHLSLSGRGRRQQFGMLFDRVMRTVPKDAPLIIAGDFNDWTNQADHLLAERLGLTEVFDSAGRPARSFPSSLPLLRLDRIYARGLHIETAQVLHGRPWSRISDHSPISAYLKPLN